MKQMMQGNFDTKQKSISDAVAQLPSLNIKYTSSLLPKVVKAFLNTVWPKRFLGYSGNYVTESILQQPLLWGQLKTSSTKSTLMFLNPAKELTFPGHFQRLMLQCSVKYGAEGTTCDTEIASTL